jgi:N-acetylglucosaminyldiphosphoundecaprenol N-acetyl-beta-D-mannosaminyltransferase
VSSRWEKANDAQTTGRLRSTCSSELLVTAFPNSSESDVGHLGAPETGSAPAAFETVELFGMPFIDAPDEQVVASHLARWKPEFSGEECRAEGRLPLIVTPNVDIVVQLVRAEAAELHRTLARADYVLPDGWPIVSVSRLARRPLQARLAGSTVFSLWWPAIVADNRKVALMVASDTVSDGLLAEHPDASTMVPPRISTEPASIDDVAADLVALGIGHPKDSLIALAAIEQWPSDKEVPLFFSLGASAELYLGVRKRAPEWAQRFGLEWFVRFLQEPRRMFTRYFVRDVAFVPIAMRELMRLRELTRNRR